jgi:ABC-2 type transport system permease protein/capsular polysaccharide transport system permease protein
MRNSDGAASTGALLNHGPWKIQRRVIGALLIREMLTRYGRNNIGFLWLFVEPMIFILIVVLIRSHLREFYHGSIPAIAFAITGWPSLMLWRNMPNRLMGALKSNRPLLHHRQVTIIDIYLTRIMLEQMATTTSVIMLSIILYSVGLLTLPEDFLQVIAGWLLLGWFGAGLALTIGSLSERTRVIQNLWRPSIYIFMPLSGVAFVIDALPSSLQQYAMWIPMLNALEFMRDGWFGSTFHAHYDLGYVLIVNLCFTFVGLSLVRQVGLDEISE